METRYFLTVDWCSQGKRGIFCSRDGKPFSSETPHTQDEMDRILGPFWMILSPQSDPFTAEEIAQYRSWYPLEEYSNQYGIVR